MDQPHPDPASTPASARHRRVARRLEAQTDEHIVAWTHGWILRDMRLHGVLAARTFDFVVLTENSLLLITTGFFTRRPRRRVFDAPLDDLTVSDEPVRRGRRLRFSTPSTRPLLLEVHDDERTAAFVAALAGHAPVDRS